MINVSNKFKEYLENDMKDYIVTVVFTLTDGTVLTLTNEDLSDSSFEIDDAISSDNAFVALGSANSAQAKVTILNTDEKYSDYVFTHATFTISVGLQLPTGIETVAKGTFIVDDAPQYNNSTITVSGLDNMIRFDELYSLSTLTYPVTLFEIVNEACTKCGVALATTNFPNKNVVVAERPTDDTLTFRDIIGYAAQVAGCYARINNMGRLELKWYNTNVLDDLQDYIITNTSDYLVTDTDGRLLVAKSKADIESLGVHLIDSIYSQSIDVDDVVITGVRASVKVEDTSVQNGLRTYATGTSDYVIDLGENNPFITTTNAQNIVNRLGQQLIGIKFRPATLSHSNTPAMEAGDIAVIRDRKDRDYPILITRTTFGVGKQQQTVSAAESPVKNSSHTFSAQTKTFVEMRKLVRQEKTERELAEEELREAIESAGGMYETNVIEQSGGTTYNLHNKPVLAESNIVLRITDRAVALTSTYNTPNPVWYGMTVDGTLIANILSVSGVSADWIKSGAISITRGGSEVFYANIDTGVVRISGGALSLNVGGTNLLRGTNTVTSLSQSGAWSQSLWRGVKGNSSSTITSSSISDCPNVNVVRAWSIKNTSAVDTQIIQDNVPVQIGSQYTMSCYVKGTGKIAFRYGVSEFVTKTYSLSGVTDWVRLSWTFVIASTTGHTKNNKTNIYFCNTGTGTVQICGMQLETGDVMTDWAPSPEDDNAAITRAIDNLNQREIFNRLTNNGTVQGIYLENNKVYINASYIKSGTIAANYLTTGLLKDKKGTSYWNLDTGVMDLRVQKLQIKSGNSYIDVSPSNFRVSSTALSWTSTNSSLTSAGILTCKGATIYGNIRGGNLASGSYLDIYDGSINVFYANTNLGFIGASNYVGSSISPSTGIRGIDFNLNYQGHYMCWASQRNSTDRHYYFKLVYANKAFGGYTANTVNLGCNLDLHGYTLKNPTFEGNGVNGTLTFKQPIRLRGDGTIYEYATAKLKFKNGILVDGSSWY